MDLYGHLFPSEADAIVQRLDAHYMFPFQTYPAPEPRPGRVLAEVVELRDTSEEQA